MTQRIHPTALIDPTARIGADVEIGPFAIIGPQVTLGERCFIAARVTLERNVRLGEDVRIGEGSVIGGPPQDLKYRGEETWVEIGDRTIVREYSTISRGTAATGATRIGKDCFLMTYVHLGHDCHLGDSINIANGTQLAGHVTVEDRAAISGLVAVHQFVIIGGFCFIGGATRVNQDIPPYVMAAGNPAELYGLNSIGLKRQGFSQETINTLKRAYRLLFNSDLNLTQAVERVRTDLPDLPEVNRLIDFMARSHRGVP